MKFKCEKYILQEAIYTVQKAITGKSTLALLEGILLTAYNGYITLIGTDIDLSIETKMKANILEEGTIVVDSKLFGELIKKLPNDEVEITTKENNTIEIVCQKSRSVIIHMESDEFPSLPEVDENIILSFSQVMLKDMIKGTSFAAAQDETRPILTGILFEIKDKKLNLVALDGLRVAVRSENIDNESSIKVVIPAKTLNEVAKILSDGEEEVKITFTKNHILFNLGKTKIISRLLVGEFINYTSIIPNEYNSKVVVNRHEMQECIERASLVAKEGNTNLVKIDINDDIMVINSNSQLGKVREELNVNMQGQPIQIAFNSKYLIDVLKIMDEDEIVLELSSSVSPCVVKNKEGTSCIYLVLPVRVLRTS